jgi:hypothetical protein
MLQTKKEMNIDPQEKMLGFIVDFGLRDLFISLQNLALQIVLTMPRKRSRNLPQKPKPTSAPCIDSCALWQAWIYSLKFQSDVLH